jgi:hypothetical protein
MNADAYWKMFLQTGSPEVYLMYKQAVKMEEANVSKGTGVGFACNGVQ